MMSQVKQILKALCVITLCVFVVVGCNRNKNPDQDAVTACNGDPYLAKFGCSVDKVQQAAEQGDPDAQYALGYMYFYGVGTVQDTKTARLWIARAAAQGQPLAQKALSLMGNPKTSQRQRSAAKQAELAKNKPAESSNPPVVAKKSQPKTIEHHLPNYKTGGNGATPVIHALKPKYAPAESTTDVNSNTEQGDAVHSTSLNHDSSGGDVHDIRAIGRNAIDSMESSLMHAPAGGYTLQLMGNHHLKTIQHYISAHHLGAEASYYYSTFDNSRWYMLVYGRYKTVKEAHAAIAKLPKSVRKNNPWIKPLRDVQAEIKTRQMVS